MIEKSWSGECLRFGFLLKKTPVEILLSNHYDIEGKKNTPWNPRVDVALLNCLE